MNDRTPEETSLFAQIKTNAFINSISPALKDYVESLPQRIEVMNASTSIKFHEMFKTADLVFVQAARHSVCVKGCSHCCFQAVPITNIEAGYIAENIKTPHVELKKSIRRDVMAFSDKTPCPFLTNDECTIYEDRPLTCRTHVSFDKDSYWCRFENWDKPGAAVPKPIIQPLWQAYHQFSGRFEPIIGDIRDFFPSGRML